MQIELAVLCALLAIFSAVLFWDRRRLQRRMAESVAKAEGDAIKLNSRRRFLEAILDSIGDPIFVKDDDHRYTYVNEAKCRLSGIKKEDILGRTGYDVTFPVREQVDVFVRRDQFVLETGREDLNEEELTDAEGVVRTVLTKKSLYVDDSGRRSIVGVIRDITERKRAEEALKRGQAAYLAEAQRLSLTGSFGWTPSTGEIHWSDETFRIFALDPAVKPTTELVLERVHPEDRELVRHAIRETSRGERDFDFTHRIVLPDGSIKYVHVLSHAVKDSAGNREVVGAIADVTEQTLHEQVLKQNDERNRFVFEHLPIALWRIISDVVPDLFKNLRSQGIVDVERYLDEHADIVHRAMEGTRVTEANRRTVQIFGARDESEVLGPAIRFWKNSAETYKKILAARYRDEAAVQFETELATLDGRTVQGVYFHMTFPLALRASDVSLGGFLDETDRVRVQSRLAAIVSSSDDAIVGKTLDGIISSWNAGATNIFGYEAEEIIGQPITRIIPPELQAEETEILKQIGRGDRIKNYQTVRVAKDGRRVDISLTVSPVLDRSGKVVGASKVARDITAEKRAEAELQQTRDELARVARVTTLGELTAAIAHEVNQPLTGVINSGNACLRWLSQETPNSEAARKSVERMISEGNRAAEVIKRLRAMVEKTPTQRERLSINGAIAEVLPLLEGQIRQKSISPQAILAGDVPPILGDRIQLQQVMLNLIINAIDAMSETALPRNLVVTSAKGEANNEVMVTVHDTGKGLDEKSLDRLFEAFYTTKAQGMGIGLAVSRTIIQAHGGLLWARPNTPRGAVFGFTLPVEVEQDL